MGSLKQWEKSKPLVGVSACLLGEKVRFDGGHKRSPVITEQLASLFEFRSYCPESAIGLGVPRKPMRLVRLAGEVRAVNIRDMRVDYTGLLEDYAELTCGSDLARLHGFIFKKGSPSCGMERVKVYDQNGVPAHNGRGVFARRLMQHDPLLPIEEEGRLNDTRLRENFITRVLVYGDWKYNVPGASNRLKAMLEFHTRYKYCLLAHDQVAYRKLGRMLAQAGRGGHERLLQSYISLVMSALKTQPSRASHSNVLMHMAGFFKRNLCKDDKQELMELISHYRNNQIPIASPLVLLQHYLRLYPAPFLHTQEYFRLQHVLMAS